MPALTVDEGVHCIVLVSVDCADFARHQGFLFYKKHGVYFTNRLIGLRIEDLEQQKRTTRPASSHAKCLEFKCHEPGTDFEIGPSYVDNTSFWLLAYSRPHYRKEEGLP